MRFGKEEIQQDAYRSKKYQYDVDIIEREHHSSHLYQHICMHTHRNTHTNYTHAKRNGIAANPAIFRRKPEPIQDTNNKGYDKNIFLFEE